MTKRVGIYVRVSTAEQKINGKSIDSQIDALTKYATDLGYEVVDIYNDAGISAHISYKKRPALMRLIEDTQKGKIDLILLTKLDRFFRSIKDYYKVMELIGDTPWRTIWEDYETETASGIFKVNIMLAVAQSESDRTSERIKAVNEYRRSQGIVVGGLAPLGYKHRKGVFYIDEDKQEGVKAFFDAYALTYSTIDSINKAEEKGVKISRPQALRMLKNRVYCGDAYGSPCPSYISEEQYTANNEAVDSHKYKKTSAKKTYLFSTLFKCPCCGGAMTSRNIRSKSKNKPRAYTYKGYQCARYALKRGCDAKKLYYESTLEKKLLEVLEPMLEDAKIKAKAKVKTKDNTTQIKKLKQRLERIGTRYEDGDISLETYRAKRDAIQQEITTLSPLSESTQLLTLPTDWREVYKELDDSHKRSFWVNIIKTFSFVDGNLTIDFK